MCSFFTLFVRMFSSVCFFVCLLVCGIGSVARSSYMRFSVTIDNIVKTKKNDHEISKSSEHIQEHTKIIRFHMVLTLIDHENEGRYDPSVGQFLFCSFLVFFE